MIRSQEGSTEVGREQKRPPKATVGFVAGTILALVLAACGTDGGEAPTDAGDGSAPAGETYTMTIAVVDPDVPSVPLLEAAQVLEEAGHDVTVEEVAEPELAIEGLVRGNFDFSGESISPALIAIQEGAPIVVIGDVVGNEWALYAGEGIESCEDLDGMRIGLFSEGSVATAMVREWIEQECSGIEPEYLVIGGSDVRAQALLAGEIDATALTIADIAVLEQEGTEVNLLVDFGESLSELRPSALYANADFVAENPEATQAFLAAVLEVHDQINADPAYLEGIVMEHLPEVDEAILESVAAEYVEKGLFDAAALTEENLAFTIEFFVGAGVIDPGLEPADIADLSHVEAAGQ